MKTRAGFTLAESMLASVVVAIAVVGIASALAAAHQQQRAMQEQGTAVQLGRSLAEEIACVQFTQPDGAIGGGFQTGVTNRAVYNDVFDYNGYTDQSPFTSLDSSEQALEPGPGYRRRVTIEMRSNPTTVAATLAAANFARVQIQVTAPSGKSVTLERWVPRMNVQR